METKQPEKNTQPKVIPFTQIKWHVPDTITTQFVTNLLIQRVEGAFMISFFEAHPGIYLEGETPPSEMSAECVGRIVVTPDVLGKFIGVFRQQLEMYNEAMKPKE